MTQLTLTTTENRDILVSVTITNTRVTKRVTVTTCNCYQLEYKFLRIAMGILYISGGRRMIKGKQNATRKI